MAPGADYSYGLLGTQSYSGLPVGRPLLLSVSEVVGQPLVPAGVVDVLM